MGRSARQAATCWRFSQTPTDSRLQPGASAEHGSDCRRRSPMQRPRLSRQCPNPAGQGCCRCCLLSSENFECLQLLWHMARSAKSWAEGNATLARPCTHLAHGRSSLWVWVLVQFRGSLHTCRSAIWSLQPGVSRRCGRHKSRRMAAQREREREQMPVAHLELNQRGTRAPSQHSATTQTASGPARHSIAI